MPTRTTRENDGIAFAPFIAEFRGGHSDARLATDPLTTVTASGTTTVWCAPITAAE